MLQTNTLMNFDANILSVILVKQFQQHIKKRSYTITKWNIPRMQSVFKI